MKKINRWLVFVLSGTFLMAGSTVVYAIDEATIKRGEQMYMALTCFACHGKEGKGMVRRRDRKNKKTGKWKYRKGDPMPGFESYPKLAGQNSKYLFTQMNDIFDGRRTNGLSAAMLGIKIMVDSTAKEGDLQAIADYLSQVK
ncbi:MAG: c-type cytochrome [SAR324 cluster bacterium]|nr:c-type cytochrome [SAR324 cluster bacterium]MBL7035673.1 c-type cytochrome [SAR324 cluster bacterium]